jgi:hypothetical protein
MIEVKGKFFKTYEESLKYFEPWIRSLTNILLKDSPEKDDCRQELRLKLWKLHKHEDRVYNSTYISRRLKWDTINFINRDEGYNWYKRFRSFDACSDQERETLLKFLDQNIEDNIELDIEIEDAIDKAKDKMSDKQYESLVLFLSGATPDMIGKFLGTRNKNITRYYLLLGEAISILRKVLSNEGIKGGSAF